MMIKITIRIPADTMRRIKRTKPEHRSKNSHIVDLLNAGLGVGGAHD